MKTRVCVDMLEVLITTGWEERSVPKDWVDFSIVVISGGGLLY